MALVKLWYVQDRQLESLKIWTDFKNFYEVVF